MISALVLHGKKLAINRQGLLMGALILGTIAIRLPLLPFHGYYNDLGTYVQWGDRAVHDLSTLYTAASGQFGGRFGGGQVVNYPPGMPYLFGLLVTIFNGVLGPALHTTLAQAINSDGIGPFFAKLPILLADVGVVVLVYRTALRHHSERFALVVAASYALSPAVLYDGAAWGQTDGLVALPLLGALVALLAERYALGGVSLALAVVLKPQPIIFVPLILLYLWRWGSRQEFWRFTGAGLATLLAFALPILFPNMQLLAMVHNMQSTTTSASTSLTSDAFNFWWAAGYGHQTLSAALFGVQSGLLGDLLFAGITLLVGVQIWQRRDALTLCLGLAIQMFGCFLFLGGQHERYLFLFIPLMLMSIIVAPRQNLQPLIVLYVGGTALCMLNMVIGVGGGTFANAQLLPYLSLPTLSTFLASDFDTLAILLAFVHCGGFGYVLYIWNKLTGTGNGAAQSEVKAEKATADLSKVEEGVSGVTIE